MSGTEKPVDDFDVSQNNPEFQVQRTGCYPANQDKNEFFARISLPRVFKRLSPGYRRFE
jgi:predicted RNase H-like nuclease